MALKFTNIAVNCELLIERDLLSCRSRLVGLGNQFLKTLDDQLHLGDDLRVNEFGEPAPALFIVRLAIDQTHLL